MRRVSSLVMALRQMRSWLPVLCIIVAALCNGAKLAGESVKDIAAPTNYITDLAGVLNSSTQDDLNALGRSLDTQAHAQLFVVTVHKIDGDEPVEQFANELFAKWKIGPAKTDRGVLLLLSIDDHKRWIEVGYGLEGILPDGKVGDIGREMVPDLRAANYDGAVRTGYNDVANVIAQDAGITLQTAVPHTYHRQGRSTGAFGGIGFFLVIVVLFLLFRGGRGGRGGGGGFLSGLLIGNLLGGSSGSSWGGSDDGFGGGGSDDSGGGFSGGEGGGSGGGGAGGSW